ncbi:DUF805 domain-containing protein [Acetobacteraceae bacterium]|nr:DUF805 domain-containing protein [Acetobacteraceae bacterium]
MNTILRLTGREYYALAFLKYAKFSGRSTRSEYWYFVLFSLLPLFAINFLTFFAEYLEESAPQNSHAEIVFLVTSLILFFVSTIVNIGTFITLTALVSRRLHDVGYSGWWQIIPNMLVILAEISCYLLYSSLKHGSPSFSLSFVLLLFTAIPFLVSFVWILVLLCTASDLETNRFGEVPSMIAVFENENFQSASFQRQAKNSFDLTSDNLELIVQLSELRDKGILTEAEFQQKKSELL